MIAVENVRAAVESHDPAGELDRLVRGHLAAGQTTAGIYTALLPLVRTIRKASPLPEDVDEILLGTLDALTGDCDPDQCYYDPPSTSLPTEPATSPAGTTREPGISSARS